MRRMRDVLFFAALAVALGVFAGCESDSTTPQDQVPPLTEDNAVFAAGYLASYIADVYDVYQDAVKNAGDKEVSTETFAVGGISGTYTLDFRAADGITQVPSGSAGWVRAFTSEGQQVEVRERVPRTRSRWSSARSTRSPSRTTTRRAPSRAPSTGAAP